MPPANTLHLAPGLSLDADYIAGASIALLGKRGSGKTYATRVLAETLFDATVQTVIIDPMGVFWAYAQAPTGSEPGYPFPSSEEPTEMCLSSLRRGHSWLTSLLTRACR